MTGLEMVHLSKRYGVTVALDRVSFRVAPGELFCLLGPNGAGKTTAIGALLGFVRPDSGVARVDGIDVAAAPREARRRAGFVPEDVALYPTLSGFENLAYFVGLVPRASGVPDLPGVLETCGLSTAVARAPASTYSRGMRQRVGLAIAVARGTRTLLLDEPMSGLDPRGAGEFGTLVRRLVDQGAAVLMTTHDLSTAARLATHIGILAQGCLVTTLHAHGISRVELEALYFRATADSPPTP